MSINSRHKTEAWIAKKSQDMSPEKTKTWIELKPNHKHRIDRKVSVVYYLSQNGLLEQPHFIEVPLSSPEGLYLRDVINRLNHLRGPGVANMFAWSSKRTYRNGYVWQDLSENDFIYPSHGHEYVLKGTRLLESSLSFRSTETACSETNSFGDLDQLRLSDVLRRSKNRSFTSLDDLNPTRTITYRAKKIVGDLGATNASLDASTQTDEKGWRTRLASHPKEEAEELSKEEISPPPCSTSSSRELGMDTSLEAGDPGRGKASDGLADIRNPVAEGQRSSGRIRASAVLMQLIMCRPKNGDDVVLPKNNSNARLRSN